MCREVIPRLIVVVLLLTLGPGRAAVAQDPPPQPKPLNTLKGVVVSQKDGAPLANVKVVLAHAEDAYIYFEEDGGLEAYGPSNTFLFFFTKRNGLTACQTRTDQEGRFTLQSFTKPSAEYNIAVADKRHGAALLTGLVPKEYEGRELRIEVAQPSYLRTDRVRYSPTDEQWSYVSVTLEPEGVEGQEKPAEAPRVFFMGMGLWGFGEEKGEKAKLGPLPGGRKYRVSLRRSTLKLPYWATIFERVVALEPGQTVEVPLKPEGGATVSGRVTALDGKPLKDVNVMVKVGTDAALVLGALTDKDGAYELAGVPTGKHELALLRHAVRTAPG